MHEEDILIAMAEEQEIAIETPEAGGNIKKNSRIDRLAIPVAIVIGAALIAGAQLYIAHNATSSAATGDPSQAITKPTIAPITNDDHVRGPRNAKFVIVEYSDVNCPFCKRAHETMKQLLANRSDVAWVYRHLPIIDPENTPVVGNALECVAELGGNDAFWQVLDETFEKRTSRGAEEVAGFAQNAGIDMAAYQTCVKEDRYASRIQAQTADGLKQGIGGTPHFFVIVNNKKMGQIGGAYPYEQMITELARIDKGKIR